MKKTSADWGGRKLSLALGVAMCSFALTAATRSVSTVDELVAAVAAASSKDTILLKSGTYDLSLVEPQNPRDTRGVASIFIDNKVLHFEGEDATSWRDKADNTTGVVLKGTNTARIVYGYAGSGRTSTFRHITFDGGVAPSGNEGGAICFVDCRFGGWASNCVFRNCQAYEGGATAFVTLRDCLFEDNEASYMGGAAKCGITRYENVNYVNEIKDCEFRGNSAQYGGAVRWRGQGLTAGCTFRTNCAELAGGAIQANNAVVNNTLILDLAFTTNCLFEGNYVTTTTIDGAYGGGAMCGAVTVVGCTFVGNHLTDNSGGAVKNVQGGVTGCVFKANAAQNGGAICGTEHPVSRCTFEGNIAYGNGGAVAGASGIVTGCVFSANVATNSSSATGGAMFGGTATGCWFTNNVCKYGGALAGDHGNAPGVAIGCEFVGNRATGYGGAAYRLSAATNCLFAYNQSTNQGGACQWCYGISACTATGNGSLAQRGGAFSESDVYDSTISNNYAYITRGGAGTKSQFTGCTFAGKGGLSGCGARDCVFTGVEPSSTSDYLFDCLHNSGGPMGITNCLITGCSGFTYLFHVEGTTGTVVNCTVAGNTITSAGRMMQVRSGAHYEKVDGKTTEVYSVPGEAAFVNCLFAGNVLADGKAADLSLSLFDAANSTGTSKCAMSNCLYTATDPSLTDANADMSGVFHGKPHFTAGDTRFPDAPYYSLRYSSAARGRGQNMGWMSDATDMAGNARIVDGTVDIGCYECILPNDGTIMIVR